MGLVWQLIARADELPLWQEAVLWEAKAAFLKIEVRRIPESKVRAFLIWVLIWSLHIDICYSCRRILTRSQ